MPLSFHLLSSLENIGFAKTERYIVLKKNKLNFVKFKKEQLYNELDGILVLGGGTGNGYVSEYRNEALLSGSAERLTKAVEIFQKNNSIKIIYSGYSGDISLKGWPEYKVAEKFFMDMGVSENNLILEKKSRNTYENIFYSKNFINENETWGLITSAYHMKRAKLVINKLNIDNKIVLIPVDFQTAGKTGLFEFNLFKGMKYWSIVLYEYVGIIYYYYLDRV